MTTIISSRESRAPAPRPTILATAAARSIAWVRHQLRLRRDTGMLLALSDHLLADMGVHRDQVGRAVRDSTRAERGPR
ncbi:hypothetical protein [Inquilinus sp. CA228]|uniref:hypothetical protein n=1 Tax=Inquilinus sp. CA228 TaxID=3455609 RepID=UPI003F8D048B